MSAVCAVLLIAILVWACLFLLTLPVLAAMMRSSQISQREERTRFSDKESNDDIQAPV
jgi:hypothetical protein